MSLILDNVCYTYMKNTPYEREALKNVSLEINKGEFVALIGHSGSGKSTLVQQMSGLLQPLAGHVFVERMDLAAKSHEAKLARRKIGLVFQYPEHQLFAETVYEDVAFGPRNYDLSEQEVEDRVKQALAFVHLPYNEFANRSPFQLSGGQMRRVAIAGVMAMQPDYLILDEPTAGLDPLMRNLFYQEIKELYKKSNVAIILVTHSMEEAIELADRLLVMSEGRIILDDKPADIFRSSKAVLRQAGVDVPAVVALADRLKECGMNLSEECLSTQTLVEEISKNLRQGGRINAQ